LLQSLGLLGFKDLEDGREIRRGIEEKRRSVFYGTTSYILEDELQQQWGQKFQDFWSSFSSLYFTLVPVILLGHCVYPTYNECEYAARSLCSFSFNNLFVTDTTVVIFFQHQVAVCYDLCSDALKHVVLDV
jgi:hypothetical protein